MLSSSVIRAPQPATALESHPYISAHTNPHQITSLRKNRGGVSKTQETAAAHTNRLLYQSPITLQTSPNTPTATPSRQSAQSTPPPSDSTANHPHPNRTTAQDHPAQL